MGLLRNLFSKKQQPTPGNNRSVTPSGKQPSPNASQAARVVMPAPDVESLKAQHDVPGLLKALGYLNYKDRIIPKAAAKALDEIIEINDVETLIAGLKDENLDVQQGAVKGLGKLGDSRAVEPLITILKSEKGYMRSEAAAALGNISDVRAFEPLYKLVTQDSEFNVRQSAIWGLREIDHNRFFERLVNSLQEKNPLIRENAAYALGRLNDDRVKDALFPLLQDRDNSVRRMAISALATLKDKRVVEILIELLKDPTQDWYGRGVVAEDLAKIGDLRAVEPLIGLLLSNLNDTSGLPLHEMWALKDLRDARAIEPMVEVLLHSADRTVRGTAAQCLAQFDDPRVLPALLTAFLHDREQTDDIYRAISEALDTNTVIPNNTVEKLEMVLDHPSGIMRDHARDLINTAKSKMAN